MRTYFLPLLFIISCTYHSKNSTLSVHRTEVVSIKLNYDSCKKEIGIIKDHCKQKWPLLNKQVKESIFTKAVAETIIPSWIGTTWDFNGTSENPQEGSIACGYFVTTVLRDAGLNLARTKLAQCASEQMILKLIQPKYTYRFSNRPIEDFVDHVKQQGYGIYIVGLDNHTGFIYNDSKEVYFIHSTFVGTRNVQKEKAAESSVLIASKYKVVGKLSEDEQVLDRWISSR